jgi:hypothetical protein
MTPMEVDFFYTVLALAITPLSVLAYWIFIFKGRKGNPECTMAAPSMRSLDEGSHLSQKHR